MGTMFHKVFEIRNLAKIAIQNNQSSFNDENFGIISIEDAHNYELMLNASFEYYKANEPHLIFNQKDYSTILEWIEYTLKTWPQYDPFNLKLVAAELFFDIEIKKDWAKFDGIIGGHDISGALRIKGTMDSVIDLGNDIYELVDYKGLPVDTPILTINGFVSMGDLKVGDIVFDQFGQQTKVIAKSDQKFKECYKITFDDTSEVICDDEHYWKLHDGKVVQIKNLCVGDKINVAKLPEARKLSNLEYRTITNIEKCGIKLTQCISVDSPDKTYLCTHNMIPTHNTGEHRKDFATGQLKDIEYLKNDFQLMLYLLALKEIFPDKTFILSLMWIRAGGIFSVMADDDMYNRAWAALQKSYSDITKMYNPSQLDPSHRDYRCKYLCAFSKPTPITNNKSLCNFYKDQIKKDGLLKVLNNNVDMKAFGKYGQGGGKLNVEQKD